MGILVGNQFQAKLAKCLMDAIPIPIHQIRLCAV